MSGIRGTGTQPELVVRKALFSQGFRYRLHRRDLPGAPDIVIGSRKVVIFVHGCFWHMHAGCKNAKMPQTRPDFWRAKLQKNVERDERAIEALNSAGWRVLVAWECATRDAAKIPKMPRVLKNWIEGSAPFGEISGATP